MTDTASFQTLINNALAAGGGTIDIPAGTFFFGDVNDPSLDPGVGNLIFRGAGRDATILTYIEGTGNVTDPTAHAMFKNIAPGPKGSIRFEHVQFRGTLPTVNTRQGGCPAWLDNYQSVSFFDCKFYNLSQMAMDIHFCQSGEVASCWFENIAADGARMRDTPNCFVHDSVFLRLGDDSIALHTSSGAPTAREGVIVRNNRIINGGPIKVLGGGVIKIEGNVLDFPNVCGIQVANTPAPEGNFPIFDLSITNNTINNLVYITGAGAPQTIGSAISVSGAAPRGSSSTHGTIPGHYDATGAAFVYPWNYLEVNTDDTTNPIASIPGVRIIGNTMRRTAPAVSAFSAYGFGSKLFQGAPYDPAITDASLRQMFGISFYGGGLVNANISGNTIESFGHGMTFAAPTSPYDYKNVLVKSNIISDFLYRGVLVNSAAFYADIKIIGNIIDGDIYRQYSNSNLNGTYASNSLPYGIDSGACTGITNIDNFFRNVCNPFSTAALPNCIVRGNIGYGSGSATFSPSNVGLGVMPASGYTYLSP